MPANALLDTRDKTVNVRYLSVVMDRKGSQWVTTSAKT